MVRLPQFIPPAHWPGLEWLGGLEPLSQIYSWLLAWFELPRNVSLAVVCCRGLDSRVRAELLPTGCSGLFGVQKAGAANHRLPSAQEHVLFSPVGFLTGIYQHRFFFRSLGVLLYNETRAPWGPGGKESEATRSAPRTDFFDQLGSIPRPGPPQKSGASCGSSCRPKRRPPSGWDVGAGGWRGEIRRSHHMEAMVENSSGCWYVQGPANHSRWLRNSETAPHGSHG